MRSVVGEDVSSKDLKARIKREFTSPYSQQNDVAEGKHQDTLEVRWSGHIIKIKISYPSAYIIYLSYC